MSSLGSITFERRAEFKGVVSSGFEVGTLEQST